jgi:mannitol/fructose-specific phosphotransferase system IIA component (Ntr-type)
MDADKIKLLEEENIKLRNELNDTKEHLKKYTSPLRNKTYYEENKEKHKQQVKEYREKTNYVYEVPPEKKKEYARRAYLNKKEKLKKEEKDKSMEENI